MAFTIQLATAAHLGKWDATVLDSEGGTLFHERAFLGYHGSRFADQEYFIVITKGEAIFGLLPAVLNKDAGNKLVSPYGSSFGGPVFKQKLVLKDAVEIMDGLQDFYRGNGVKQVSYTLSPSIYSSNSDILEFCLLKNGYATGKADLFHIVPVKNSPEAVSEAYEGRVRTTLRKEKEQYTIETDTEVGPFYEILLIDKGEKNSVPTHKLEDLLYLKKTYPDRVRIDIARHTATGALFAVCYFLVSRDSWMTFYIAQDKKELRLNGVTVLIDAFLCSIAGRYKFLDFGGSTFGYEISNMGVASFKESFGANSYLRKTFTCNLS